MKSNTDFTAYIGVDWSDRKHDYCLAISGETKREFGVIEHQPQAIEAWVQSLRNRFSGSVALCLEIDKGPLIYALQKYDFLVLFPINPAMLAKYREAFVPSRAKDDPTDAELALELLLLHREKLKPLQPESIPMRTLRFLVEQRRHLVDERVSITNRLTYALKQYYPQVLEWFKRSKDTYLFCDFLSRWPTLRQLKQARKHTLETFFHEHNVRGAERIGSRIDAIRSAVVLTDDPAVILPHQLLVLSLIGQLRAILQAIEDFDDQIEAVAQTLPDYALFRALPGAGAALAPRLLVAFGEQRERYPNAGSLQKYMGVAPVTERSGKKTWVHWRWQCPTFLRQTFVEWAAHSVSFSFWARTYYFQQREKGREHQTILRALAFKWIRILYRCWQDRTPYDESTYLTSLQRRGSPLISRNTELKSATAN